MTILGGCPGSLIFFVFWCQFSKSIFAEDRSTRSKWCLEKNKGPIWRSNDHLVMKGLSKNVENHENRLPPCHVRPNPTKVRGNRFVWSMPCPWAPPDLPNINLNCQKTSFCEKTFFLFFGPRAQNRHRHVFFGQTIGILFVTKWHVV